MKRLLSVLTLLALLCTCSTAGAADNYPNAPIKIVTSSSPGSTLDTLVRTKITYYGEVLGVPIVLDNHPGGQFVTGLRYLVYNDKHDGYMYGSWAAPIFVDTLKRANLHYEDFAYIGALMDDPGCLVVRANSDINTLEDLLKAFKERPGELVFAYTSGSPAHIALNWLCKNLDIPLPKQVGYNSGGDARVDFLGDHVQIKAETFSGAAPYYPDEMKIICAFSRERVPGFEDIPTAAEELAKMGYNDLNMSALSMSSIRFFATTAETKAQNPERFKILADALGEVGRNQTFLEWGKSTGYDIVYLDGDTVTEMIKNQWDNWLE